MTVYGREGRAGITIGALVKPGLQKVRLTSFIAHKYHLLILSHFRRPSVMSNSECNDDSCDDDESFESCEPQKNSSGNSPQLHSDQAKEEPSPATAAVSAVAHMHVDASNPFHSLAVDSAESSPLAAPLPAEALHQATAVASASNSPAASSASSESRSETPDESDSGAKVADATDGTDDVDQGQIFDCFDLKIVYERGRTGFEDTKEIDFTPGMLIAVSAYLPSSNC
jgi:hypothetical protein